MPQPRENLTGRYIATALALLVIACVLAFKVYLRATNRALPNGFGPGWVCTASRATACQRFPLDRPGVNGSTADPQQSNAAARR